MRARRRNDHWELRASDADRDHVAELLGEHCAAGRLTLDELHARLDEAHRARTYRELAAVTRELPRLEERRVPKGLPVRRHVLANAAVVLGWLALTTPTPGHIGFPLPLLTILASVLLLGTRAAERRRRPRPAAGRWQVVPADRWRAGVTPPAPWLPGAHLAARQLADWTAQWAWGGHPYPARRPRAAAPPCERPRSAGLRV